MLNTLVSIVNEYMGSQWALFMPREDDDGKIFKISELGICYGRRR